MNWKLLTHFSSFKYLTVVGLQILKFLRQSRSRAAQIREGWDPKLRTWVWGLTWNVEVVLLFQRLRSWSIDGLHRCCAGSHTSSTGKTLVPASSIRLWPTQLCRAGHLLLSAGRCRGSLGCQGSGGCHWLKTWLCSSSWQKSSSHPSWDRRG